MVKIGQNLRNAKNTPEAHTVHIFCLVLLILVSLCSLVIHGDFESVCFSVTCWALTSAVSKTFYFSTFIFCYSCISRNKLNMTDHAYHEHSMTQLHPHPVPPPHPTFFAIPRMHYAPTGTERW